MYLINSPSYANKLNSTFVVDSKTSNLDPTDPKKTLIT